MTQPPQDPQPYGQQPQQPQQPYGGQQPQPGYAPYAQPPQKKKKWPWILLAIVVVIIAVVAGCTALVSGAIDSVDEESKKEVVVTYEVTGESDGAIVTYTGNNFEHIPRQCSGAAVDEGRYDDRTDQGCDSHCEQQLRQHRVDHMQDHCERQGADREHRKWRRCVGLVHVVRFRHQINSHSTAMPRPSHGRGIPD
jgi:hypothetical protein